MGSIKITRTGHVIGGIYKKWVTCELGLFTKWDGPPSTRLPCEVFLGRSHLLNTWLDQTSSKFANLCGHL